MTAQINLWGVDNKIDQLQSRNIYVGPAHGGTFLTALSSPSRGNIRNGPDRPVLETFITALASPWGKFITALSSPWGKIHEGPD